MAFKHKCERKLTGEHNHCSACGEYFNSNHAFEKHRVGDFGVDRRCATVAEMEGKGMVKNSGGWWVGKKSDAESISRRTAD
jgi:hypothetical protein